MPKRSSRARSGHLADPVVRLVQTGRDDAYRELKAVPRRHETPLPQEGQLLVVWRLLVAREGA